MVICLERGADLHIAQPMPLPLTVSCSSKIQIGFTFLVPAHPGSPGQRAVKRGCVTVCLCSKNAQRTIDELRANVSDLETRLRNETSRLKSRYETEHHEMEMQIDVLGRNNAELSKNNKGLLAKLKVGSVSIVRTDI